MKKKTGFSPEHILFLRKNRNKTLLVWFFRIGILVSLIALWEVSARTGLIDAFIFSSPSRMLSAMKTLVKNNNLFMHAWVTLYETLAGFFIATAVGTAVALLLWWSDTLRRILDPYIVVLNSLPKIALGPIIIIAMGAGTKAIIFMAVLITVIVTILTMLNSFTATDPNKILLLKSLGAKKHQILTKLVLPQSMPDFVSMLKINVGLSWIGSIMGEYLVSRAGLGYLIIYGGQVFKFDLVMLSTVILCVLAAGMYSLVALFEKLAVKWKE